MTALEALAAVVAAIRTEGGKAYSLAQLAALTSRPTAYNEVHVIDTVPVNARVGDAGDRHYRILIRSVAQQYGDALAQREKARTALLGRFLTTDGGAVGPSIDDEPIGPDEGWFSGISEFVASL